MKSYYAAPQQALNKKNMEFEPVRPSDIVEGVKYRMVLHSPGEEGFWDGVFCGIETTMSGRHRYVFKAVTPQAFVIVSEFIPTGAVLGLPASTRLLKTRWWRNGKRELSGLVLKGLVDEHYDCNYLKASDKGPFRMLCFMKTHNKRVLTIETAPRDLYSCSDLVISY